MTSIYSPDAISAPIGVPQEATQYAVPPITKFAIPLGKDRSTGEYIPTLGGSFLKVDYCDLPARLSFNNLDASQSIPLVPGMLVRGNFTGITIFNDDYSAYSVENPQIVLTVGRNGSIEIDNQFTQQGIPIPRKAVAQAAGTSTWLFPVPYGYKQIRVKGYRNGAGTGDLRYEGVFKLIDSTQVLPKSMTRNGNVFNAAGLWTQTGAVEGLVSAGGAVGYNIDLLFAIPSNAETLNLVFTANGQSTAAYEEIEAFAL